jgi:hypothetical protein
MLVGDFDKSSSVRIPIANAIYCLPPLEVLVIYSYSCSFPGYQIIRRQERGAAQHSERRSATGIKVCATYFSRGIWPADENIFIYLCVRQHDVLRSPWPPWRLLRMALLLYRLSIITCLPQEHIQCILLIYIYTCYSFTSASSCIPYIPILYSVG